MLPLDYKAVTARRQQLRFNQTPAETTLWAYLRQYRKRGTPFRRQHSVGPYVLDFYSVQLQLAIEADGSQHTDSSQRLHDERRGRYLARRGLTVLRFWNSEIQYDFDLVERVIETTIGAILARVAAAIRSTSPRPPSNLQIGR